MRLATTTLVFCVAALSALGLVMIFSASTATPEVRYLFWQPIWCGIGFVAFLVAAACDYTWLKKYSWLPWAFLGGTAVLLILALGSKPINGARRWIGHGGFRIQPSELAKIAMIVALAWYSERFQRDMPKFIRGIVIPGGITCVVLGLIFLEPDVGTALLIGSVSCIILLIAGIRLSYFLPPVLVLVALLGLYLSTNQVRSARIYSWLHLEETKLDKGMQVWQGIIALGSGGWTGVGLGDGRQKLGFVPEHHTDFILSVIGEELGLTATLGIIVAYLTILCCGIYIAWHARDTFGMLLAAGLTFMIVLQAVINIGVVTGALPNKGLSLPFISYGGSNLVIMFTAIGLLLSVARQAVGPRQLLQAQQSGAPAF